MERELDKLEKLVDDLLERQKELEHELRVSKNETERLKHENSELSAMIKSQSTRVDALLRKLELTLEEIQKNERGVHGEANDNIRFRE